MARQPAKDARVGCCPPIATSPTTQTRALLARPLVWPLAISTMLLLRPVLLSLLRLLCLLRLLRLLVPAEIRWVVRASSGRCLRCGPWHRPSGSLGRNKGLRIASCMGRLVGRG
jgi:hypothetical protein